MLIKLLFSWRVRSSFVHTRRWSFINSCMLLITYYIVIVTGDFDVAEACSKTIMTSIAPKICNCLFTLLFLLYFHVNWMFCYCWLLDKAVASSWEYFCFMNLLTVSKLDGTSLLWSVVPFFVSRSAILFPLSLDLRVPTGKQYPSSLRSFMISLASFTFGVVFKWYILQCIRARASQI